MQPRNSRSTPKNDKKEPQKRSDVRGNGSLSRARANLSEAHKVAMQDIEQDAELSIHSPNDYLDEGETARLGEDITDLI